MWEELQLLLFEVNTVHNVSDEPENKISLADRSFT